MKPSASCRCAFEQPIKVGQRTESAFQGDVHHFHMASFQHRDRLLQPNVDQVQERRHSDRTLEYFAEPGRTEIDQRSQFLQRPGVGKILLHHHDDLTHFLQPPFADAGFAPALPFDPALPVYSGQN